MTNKMLTWDLGDTPGEFTVNLGVSGKVVGIRCGGPDNGIVVSTERLVNLASALLEAAGIAGQAVHPRTGFRATSGELAGIHSVLAAAGNDANGVHLNGLAVLAILQHLDERRTPVADEEQLNMGRAAVGLLQDLDRCEHGRHSLDSCFHCPGGRSAGNQLLKPDTVVGTDYRGEPITAPEQELRVHPENWRR